MIQLGTRRRGRWAALCCAASLMMASAASAQDTSRPHLLTAPDAQALSDNFPVVALATGVSGHVSLQCDVAADGSAHCTAAEEAPANMGFGAAAETLARDWRFSPKMENGRAVAATARVGIAFQNENSEAVVIAGQIPVDAERSSGSPREAPDVNEDQVIAMGGCRFTRQSGACSSPIFVDPQSQPPTASPDRDFLPEFYPEEAIAANADGRALVACAVRSAGNLDCVLEREFPVGLGFGAAALRLVNAFTAHGANGLPAGSTFRVPVDFALHDRGRARSQHLHYDRMPVGTDYAHFYPDRAANHSQGGRAIAVCLIGADRTLSCGFSDEDPVGWGFGVAAAHLANIFRIDQASFGTPGLSAGDRIQVRLTFRFG